MLLGLPIFKRRHISGLLHEFSLLLNVDSFKQKKKKKGKKTQQQTILFITSQASLSAMDPEFEMSGLDDFQGSLKVPNFYDIHKAS